MCRIFAWTDAKGQAAVSDKELKETFERNKDGIGIAFKKGNKVYYKKGIGYDEAIKIMRGVKTPGFIHFRSTSTGSTIKSLCHPFPVSPNPGSVALEGEADAVMAHNGTWTDWKASLFSFLLIKGIKLKPHDIFSDTRLLACLAGHCGEGIFDNLGAGRVVVLDKDGLRFYSGDRGEEWTKEGKEGEGEYWVSNKGTYYRDTYSYGTGTVGGVTYATGGRGYGHGRGGNDMGGFA